MRQRFDGRQGVVKRAENIGSMDCVGRTIAVASEQLLLLLPAVSNALVLGRRAGELGDRSASAETKI
jgi:hypothetical protein